MRALIESFRWQRFQKSLESKAYNSWASKMGRTVAREYSADGVYKMSHGDDTETLKDWKRNVVDTFGRLIDPETGLKGSSCGEYTMSKWNSEITLSTAAARVLYERMVLTDETVKASNLFRNVTQRAFIECATVFFALGIIVGGLIAWIIP